jgi:hypothetical protein
LSVASVLKKYDVVITTFHTLGSEYGTSKLAKAPTPIPFDSDSDSPTFRPKKKAVGAKKQAASPLFDLKWLRVVIGECLKPEHESDGQMRLRTSRTTIL